MQLLLLLITLILSFVLYKMLSSHRATYPFIRTTRVFRTDDDTECSATESEQGLITVDKNTVIVDGHEYCLRTRKGQTLEAYLNVNGGKLISICIVVENGEKSFFIDPEHSLFATIQEKVSGTQTTASHIFSV